jgi:hypothetical protein
MGKLFVRIGRKAKHLKGKKGWLHRKLVRSFLLEVIGSKQRIGVKNRKRGTYEEKETETETDFYMVFTYHDDYDGGGCCWVCSEQ